MPGSNRFHFYQFAKFVISYLNLSTSLKQISQTSNGCLTPDLYIVTVGLLLQTLHVAVIILFYLSPSLQVSLQVQPLSLLSLFYYLLILDTACHLWYHTL